MIFGRFIDINKAGECIDSCASAIQLSYQLNAMAQEGKASFVLTR